ncbi:MAG: tryptophan--tRNA ligase [bacterium]
MRVLTGIQPTNILHIGNLFGALIPATELQRDNDVFMMIADYHAITVPQSPEDLRDNILFTTAAYIAAGIDPKRTVLFQQSQVSAHTELGWILQCSARMGEAERMTQFKDKARGKAENVSVGLFTYPVLMAADILLYGTEVVPVGADQKQHVELARDLAERFNRDFGDTFVVPEPMIKTHGARLKSLSDPEVKMSKSAASSKSFISIMDTADIIAKKIRSAVTDSEPGVRVDDNRLGLLNLLTIYSLVTEETMTSVAERYDGKGIKDLKDDLAEALAMYLVPLQAEIKGLMENRDELVDIIRIGSEAAAEVANKKLTDVKNKLGIAF